QEKDKKIEHLPDTATAVADAIPATEEVPQIQQQIEIQTLETPVETEKVPEKKVKKTKKQKDEPISEPISDISSEQLDLEPKTVVETVPLQQLAEIPIEQKPPETKPKKLK